jgi:hypothetical protein
MIVLVRAAFFTRCSWASRAASSLVKDAAAPMWPGINTIACMIMSIMHSWIET